MKNTHKKYLDETGSSTIQGAYALIFTTILIILIINLGIFFYQKHKTENDIKSISLKVADLTINENTNCNQAINNVITKHNISNKNKITIDKKICKNDWIQIQGSSRINILKIPITITAISRAGIK